MSESDSQRPDLEAVRQAIASGDPVQEMPAITQLRHCSDIAVSLGTVVLQFPLSVHCLLGK